MKEKKAELQRQALEYRKAGTSYRFIAEKLGISLSTAHGYVAEAIKQVRQNSKETAEDLIELEKMRLDAGLAAIWNQVLGGNLKAVRELRENSESRRKLLGLDKPTKISPTTPDGTQPYPAYGLDLSRLSEDELTTFLQLAQKAFVPESGDPGSGGGHATG